MTNSNVVNINDYLPTFVKDELSKSFLGQFLLPPKTTRTKTDRQPLPETSETSASSGEHRFEPLTEEEQARLGSLVEQNRLRKQQELRLSSSRRTSSRKQQQRPSVLKFSGHDSMNVHEMAAMIEDFDADEFETPKDEDVMDATTTDDWNMRGGFGLPDDFQSQIMDSNHSTRRNISDHTSGSSSHKSSRGKQSRRRSSAAERLSTSRRLEDTSSQEVSSKNHKAKDSKMSSSSSRKKMSSSSRRHSSAAHRLSASEHRGSDRRRSTAKPSHRRASTQMAVSDHTGSARRTSSSIHTSDHTLSSSSSRGHGRKSRRATISSSSKDRRTSKKEGSRRRESKKQHRRRTSDNELAPLMAFPIDESVPEEVTTTSSVEDATTSSDARSMTSMSLEDVDSKPQPKQKPTFDAVPEEALLNSPPPPAKKTNPNFWESLSPMRDASNHGALMESMVW